MPVKKTIIFESFNGKLPSDNPYYIWMEIEKELSENKEWKIYWGIKKGLLSEAKIKFPEINFISRFSMKWLWHMTTASYWVFNSRMPHWLKKNKKTVYIQTWHGTPLKKLGINIETVKMPGAITSLYHQNFIKETKRWDYLIAPNQYSMDIFKDAFKFENKFLSIGYPRNDILVQKKDDNKFIEKLKEKIIGHSKGRIFLYAPTWRDDYYIEKGVYKFNLPFSLEKLLQKMRSSDTLIIRPHYLVKDLIDISGYEDRVLVCSDTEINELFLISDLLITDYSSVMFDYSILLKPIMLYAYDFEHYKDELRGFYVDIEKNSPGEFIKSEEIFYNEIEKFEVSEYMMKFEERLRLFHLLYNNWEKGTASESVKRLILSCKD